MGEYLLHIYYIQAFKLYQSIIYVKTAGSKNDKINLGLAKSNPTLLNLNTKIRKNKKKLG